VPIKHNIASTVVIKPSKNANLSIRRKNDCLNLETIAIPKTDISKIIKINHSVMTKKPYIVSTSSIMKPTTSNARLQPKSNITGISYNKKNYSKPIQELKRLSNEAKSEMSVVPYNIMSMVVRNGESRNQSLKSNSMPTIVNAIGTSVGDSVNQQKKVFVTSSKIVHDGINNANKFVAHMQKLSDGKFKMIQTHGKVPVGLENVLKRNSQCVKPKGSMISPQYTRGTTQFKQNLIPTGISYKMSKTYDFGKLNIDKRTIPHTITSKDALENSKNIATNNSIQEKRVSSGFIQLTPRTESLSHLDGQPLNITRYG